MYLYYVAISYTFIDLNKMHIFMFFYSLTYILYTKIKQNSVLKNI